MTLHFNKKKDDEQANSRNSKMLRRPSTPTLIQKEEAKEEGENKMELLEKRTYTRQELNVLLSTDMPCRIRGKLDNYGYIYIENGRGKDYSITITEITKRAVFIDKAIKVLGFKEQTDFKVLRYFMYYFFFDEKFQQLTYEGMANFLSEKGYYPPSIKTIGIYCNTLYKHNYFSLVGTDFIYTGYKNQEKVEITEEEFKSFYRFYYNLRKEKEKKKKKGLDEEMKISLKEFGYSSPPHKRPKRDVCVPAWEPYWEEIL